MNNLEVFKNEEFGGVRTITIDNEPYFVGKDVVKILEYSNTRKVLSDHVDEEDKTDWVTSLDSIGGSQNSVCINESGLYSLILSSKLPNARKFKHWITREVLHAIRKHEMYAIDDLIANPDLGIAALNALKEEREKNKKIEEKLWCKHSRFQKCSRKPVIIMWFLIVKI